jgi:predicted HicB family RNase H-like nuclease
VSNTIHLYRVPEHVSGALVVRAAVAGVSLSEYVRTLLVQTARQPSIAAPS